MAIVQISKIVHRTGANEDLPQLDIGELGYATDTGNLYIGNDPDGSLPQIDGKFHSQILTSSSDFSQVSTESFQIKSTPTPGHTSQPLFDIFANVDGIYVTNLTTSTTHQITLGPAV
jgi:hypothetical protein